MVGVGRVIVRAERVAKERAAAVENGMQESPALAGGVPPLQHAHLLPVGEAAARLPWRVR